MDLTGKNRNTLEKFYTHPQIAKKCVKTLSNFIPLDGFSHFVEPSAGLGVFLDVLKEYNLSNEKEIYGGDISSTREDIVNMDFLQTPPSQIESWRHGKTLVFGNPPFGRQSKTLKRFIKQSICFAQTIAFILPRSFLKASLQKIFPLEFHLVHSETLPSHCFQLENGQRHHVPCVFQIWDRRSTFREQVPKHVCHRHYQFTTNPEEAQACFRRVGVYAGQVSPVCEFKSKSSHYFLQFSFEIEQHVPTILDKLSACSSWNSDYTVGPKSISKQELMEKLNEIMTSVFI